MIHIRPLRNIRFDPLYNNMSNIVVLYETHIYKPKDWICLREVTSSSFTNRAMLGKIKSVYTDYEKNIQVLEVQWVARGNWE